MQNGIGFKCKQVYEENYVILKGFFLSLDDGFF